MADITSRLRRWFGPTRAQLRAEVALWEDRTRQRQAERNEAHARAKAAEERNRQILNEIHNQLNEPGRVEGCAKVRFHRQGEADDWAEHVAQVSGEPLDVYNVYQCKRCPRSPVTHSRYWHVGHIGTKEAQRAKVAAARERGRQTARAYRSGQQIRQQVDPQVLDQLRRIVE